MDPRTGRTLDGIRPHIEAMDFLSSADRQLVFEDNARAVFKLPAGEVRTHPAR